MSGARVQLNIMYTLKVKQVVQSCIKLQNITSFFLNPKTESYLWSYMHIIKQIKKQSIAVNVITDQLRIILTVKEN